MARRMLLLLLAVGAVTAAAANAADTPRALRADTDCGTVMAEGFPFDVHVTKGSVPCPKAQEVARTDLGLRSCGTGKLPACVSHGFHCRGATFELQRKTGIGIFCYTLERPLSPREDQSQYRLSLFTRAITIYVSEE